MGFLTAHATIRFSRPGVMPYPRGEYSPSVTDYRWDGDRRDVVHYNGIWYAVKKFDPTGYVPAGQYPSASSAYWTVTSQFEIVITSMMMADAIRTNALNVNDKFKVYTDGSVRMQGEFSNENSFSKLLMSNGFIRIMSDLEGSIGGHGFESVRLSVNDEGIPELMLRAGTPLTKIVTISPNGITFYRAGDGVHREINLTIDPLVIGDGVIKKTSDGMLYLSEDSITKYKLTIKTSGGGSTYPSTGVNYVNQGETIFVNAYPDSGYEFDRWSDGGAKSHSVTINRDNYELTAYFREIEETSVNYTVTLSASPSAGGTVSGGGTYAKGTVRTVTATPNPGYIFTRWSDGGAQSHSVAWDSTKSLVAYFEKYTVTTGELFSGTELTSGTYWSKSGSSVIISVANGTANSTFHNGNLTSYVAFNKGYLSGKIKQGHKYRLTMNVQSSVAETAFVGVLGEELDVGKTVNGEALFYGNLMNDGVISTSPKTLTADFTATERGSTANDAFIFTVSQACVISINSISLKEIST